MQIQKAVRSQRKGRIALCGPTGSGKTYTALKIGSVLGSKIGVIDTENHSASLYSDQSSFDVINLEVFSPAAYTEAIGLFANAGYDVLIIDSFSHAWIGTEGILQQADKIAARMKNPNSYTAWKEATPMHQQLIDAILNFPGHVIVTMRSKMEYAQEKDNNGKTTIRKVGMAPVQREGVEYEFDIVGDMDVDHQIVITKSRCFTLADHVERKPGEKLANTIKSWLEQGEAPKPPEEVPKATPLEKMIIRVMEGERRVYPTDDVVYKARVKYIDGKNPKECTVEELEPYLAHIIEKWNEKKGAA